MKKQTTNIVEINGKRYDAVSGRLLAGAGSAEPAPKPDHAVATPKAVSTRVKPKSIVDVKRVPAPAAKRQPADRSHTLMRHAVKKPSTASLKRSVRVHTPTDLLAPAPVAVLAPKLSFDALDEKRLKRAERVAKSRLVSRFNLSAEPPKVSHPALPAEPLAAAPVPAAATPRASSPSLDIFERAMQRADSHLQKPPKKTAHRRGKRLAVRAGAAAAVVIALGGLITLQNLTTWQLRYAGSKAGFALAMPAYHPAGFSLRGYTYAPGNAELHFAGSDQRTYTLRESVSNWDSMTLLDSYIIKTVAGQQYQSIDAGGRTIYLYGQNDASWVSGNVWYQLHSGDALSTSQVIKIAASL